MRKIKLMTLPGIVVLSVAAAVGATVSIGAVLKSMEDRELRAHGEILAGGPIFHNTAISGDGSLLLISLGSTVRAIDTDTGATLWEREDGAFDLPGVKISRDGSRIITSRTPIVLDGATGEEIRDTGYSFAQVLAISPDNSLFAHVHQGELYLESIDHGNVIFQGELPISNPHVAGMIRASTFDDSSTRFAFHSINIKEMFLVDTSVGELEQFTGPDLYFGSTRTCFSPALDMIVYKDIGVGIVALSFPDGEELFRHDYEEQLYDMVFSPDGNALHLVLSDPNRNTAEYRTIDTSNGEVLSSNDRTRGDLLAVYTRNGAPGYLESWKDSLRFLDADGDDDRTALPIERGYHLRALPFLGGEKIMVVDTNRRYSIMDPTTGLTEPWDYLPWSPAYYSIVVSGDSDIAMMQSGRSVISMNLSTREQLHVLRELVSSETSILDITKDGSIAAVAMFGGEEVMLVDPKSNETISTITTEGRVFNLALSMGGGYIALVHDDRVTVRETESGTVVHEVDFDHDLVDVFIDPSVADLRFRWPVADLVVSDNGKHVAIYTERTTLWHLDMEEGTCTPILMPEARQPYDIYILQFQRPRVNMVFSPDGYRLLLSPRAIDGTLRRNTEGGALLVDLRDYEVMREYLAVPPGMPVPPHDSLTPYLLSEAIFSPDGTSVIAIKPWSNEVVIHDSGIVEDDVELVTGNLLSRTARLPSTAPGVDVSGDGVLDAADLIYARH